MEKKYKVYINSGNIYMDTEEKMFKLDQEMLSRGINGNLYVEDIMTKKDANKH